MNNVGCGMTQVREDSEGDGNMRGRKDAATFLHGET